MGADLIHRDGSLPWYLHVASGSEPSSVYPLQNARTRIGREAEAGADLVLPDPAVSRVHAVIVGLAGEDTLWVQDSASSNGLFINGRKVDGASVRAGDVIRIGDSMLVVGRGTPAPEEEAGDLGLVGQSPPIADLRSLLRKVAPSTLSVLTIGATGTGKELVARALHDESGRRGQFVAVNCAALPGTLVENVLFGHRKGAYTGAVTDQDGAFVQADGGTLFLDEVGDLALEAQPKLLRALENGEVTPIGATQSSKVDVRVVAATHVPLDAAMEAGRFRRDLYGRLAGVVVRTPALAERRDDILMLFRSFLGDGDVRAMSADFIESMLVYGWPFNVRELRKLAERLLVLHGGAPRWERGMLDEEMHLPGDSAPPPPAPEPKAPHPTTPPTPKEGPPAREELIALLDKCDGNVSRVAELVLRNRKQVYRWMEQLGIERGTGRKE
ncbi:Sigma-54 dependent DNA-binding response regulator [Minicystis rosea]|nr:Sigma-54 dependent DNA-binding response regulator [Minicystis rosea]